MGILDEYAPLRAWSTTLDRDSYTGDCVRVRRSSDDSEQDIGFDGSGNIDVGALDAFLGGSDGYVTIAYSQDANARNFIQPVPANQPRIGLRTDDNGLPMITTVRDGDRYLYTDDSISNEQYSAYFKMRFESAHADSFKTSSTRFAQIMDVHNTSINRASIELAPEVGTPDYFALRIRSTGTSTNQYNIVEFPEDDNVDRVITALRTGGLDGMASLFFDGEILDRDIPFGSASGTGINIGASSIEEVRMDMHFSSFYIFDAYHDEPTRQAIDTFLVDAPIEVGPVTKDGVLQAGVMVQVTAYDDDAKNSGKQDVGDYVTDVDGMITIPNEDIPEGKILFPVPHFKDGTSLFSDQIKSTTN